jgi:hypothetical protein
MVLHLHVALVANPRSLVAFSLTSAADNEQKNVLGFFSAAADKSAKVVVIESRDARWYIFKPKIPNWVNFGVSCNDSR